MEQCGRGDVVHMVLLDMEIRVMQRSLDVFKGLCAYQVVWLLLLQLPQLRPLQPQQKPQVQVQPHLVHILHQPLQQLHCSCLLQMTIVMPRLLIVVTLVEVETDRGGLLVQGRVGCGSALCHQRFLLQLQAREGKQEE